MGGLQRVLATVVTQNGYACSAVKSQGFTFCSKYLLIWQHAVRQHSCWALQIWPVSYPRLMRNRVFGVMAHEM